MATILRRITSRARSHRIVRDEQLRCATRNQGSRSRAFMDCQVRVKPNQPCFKLVQQSKLTRKSRKFLRKLKFLRKKATDLSRGLALACSRSSFITIQEGTCQMSSHSITTRHRTVLARISNKPGRARRQTEWGELVTQRTHFRTQCI